MSGINWDIVTVQCQQKSADFAKAHPNFTVEAAYYAGYMECAAERESLRVINARLEKERLNTPPTAESVIAQAEQIMDKLGYPATEINRGVPAYNLPKVTEQVAVTPAPSLMGSFM